MSKRVLILTGTTDILRQPNETDNTMEEVFDLTLPSKQRYAKKHGYDLLSLRSFGTDKNKLFDDTELGFLRELRTFEMLEHYDVVMWVDADAIITNDNFSINHFELDDNHCFYASWDWTGSKTISTGNFIIQKCESTDFMFKSFLQVGKHVKDTKQWGWEQTTMNLIYRHTQFKDYMKVLEHKFLNSVPKESELLPVWQNRMRIFAPWTNQSFLAHLTGISNSDRIKLLTTYFKDHL